MKFGIWLPALAGLTTGPVLDEVAAQLEQRALDSVWVGEHVVFFDEYESKYPYSDDGTLPAAPEAGIFEPLTVLTYLAAQTSRVRLGTAVFLLPQRNPVYTAKTAATLDVLSSGRLDLGIGVGWSREEFAAAGVAWPHRGRRTDEYLDLLSVLWREDPSAFSGKFYTLESCRMHPKPLQNPLPIHVGGETTAARRRVAQRGNGWFTFSRLPNEFGEPLSELDKLLAEQGRSRGDITVTVCPYRYPLTAELVEQYAEAGADQVVGLLIAADADGVRAAFDGLDAAREKAASL